QINKLQISLSNGEADQSQVAIKANIDSPATQKAIAALKARTIAEGVNSGSIDEQVNPAHTVARVDIPLVGKGTDAKSNAALRKLRNEILPATIGKVNGAQYAVTGTTADSAAQNALLKRNPPIVFGFVLLLAFA